MFGRPRPCAGAVRVLMKVLLLALMLIGSCDGPARPQADHGSAELRLEVVEHAVDGITLKWTFTNHHPFPVMVPWRWQFVATSPDTETPAAFLVPPGELLLVLADLRISDQQTEQQIIEYAWPNTDYREVAPGRSTRGQFHLPLPFALPFPEGLKGVFGYEGRYPNSLKGVFGKEEFLEAERMLELAEVPAVRMAVRYKLYGKGGPGTVTPELHAESVAAQAIEARKRELDDEGDPTYHRLILSTRLELRIPLKEPYRIYFDDPARLAQ